MRSRSPTQRRAQEQPADLGAQCSTGGPPHLRRTATPRPLRGPSGGRCRRTRRRRRPGTRPVSTSRPSQLPAKSRPGAAESSACASSVTAVALRRLLADREQARRFGRSTPMHVRMNSDPISAELEQVLGAGVGVRARVDQDAGRAAAQAAARRSRAGRCRGCGRCGASEAASIAPVGPAETTASAEPSRTSRQAVHHRGVRASPGRRRRARRSTRSRRRRRRSRSPPIPAELGLELVADPAHEHAHVAGCGITCAGDDLGRGVVAAHAVDCDRHHHGSA